MNTGTALSAVIKQELKGLILSIQQQARLQSILKGDGGDFEPEDFELAIFDVKLMVLDEKIDDLLTLLKQLPLAGKTLNKIHYMINGKRCNKGDFFNGNGLKGQRSIRGIESNPKKFVDMTEEEYSKTMFAGTRLGDVMGVELFGAGYAIIKEVKHTHTTHKDAPETIFKRSPYTDIGGGTLTEKEEFEFNEGSKPEVRRDRLHNNGENR